ncbi:CTL-like protein 1 [Nymphon striatum]|nr:CTL-like protein 1 [Nymphon striatum]
MLITCVKSNDTTNTVEDLKFTGILQTDLNCYIAPPGFLVPNMCWCCGKGSTEEDANSKRVDKPRGCTDVLCLAIFITFWAVMIFVAAFAFVVGNPMRLVNGFDSFGNVCGVDNRNQDSTDVDKQTSNNSINLAGLDMSDRPYVFFFDLHNLKKCWKTCVKVCPDRDIKSMSELREFEEDTGSQLCRYDKYFKNSESDENKRAHHPVLNRCVPTKVEGFVKSILYNIYAYLNNIDVLQQVAGDLYGSWKEILGLTFLAFIMAFVVVILIHYVAAFVSWIIMIFVLVTSLAITILLWWTYVDVKYELDLTPYVTLLDESVKNEKALLCYSIIATIITLVVALFREASACVSAMPCLLLQPVWTALALLLFFVYWIIVMVALATAEYGKHKTLVLSANSSSPSDFFEKPGTHEPQRLTLVDYSDPEPSWVRFMWWFHLIGLIWTSEFILACQQMVIAGAVSYWYFSRNRKELKCPIAMSIYKLTIYHLGSVALGSFIITLIKIPRLILMYLQAMLKKYDENKCANFCLKCCQCCLWCFEKCIRYLNHNAYTVIAIDGIGFCPAARVAFQALVSNALRVATINSVGDFILFLGKCAVAAFAGFIGLLIMKEDENLHFYAVPIFVVVLFAFLIAHCVLSVYEMVIDTMFLCFCEDYDKNDGTASKPYYAPPSLLKFMTNRKIEDTVDQVEPLQGSSPKKVDSVVTADDHEMKRFSGSTEKTIV